MAPNREGREHGTGVCLAMRQNPSSRLIPISHEIPRSSASARESRTAAALACRTRRDKWILSIDRSCNMGWGQIGEGHLFLASRPLSVTRQSKEGGEGRGAISKSITQTTDKRAVRARRPRAKIASIWQIGVDGPNSKRLKKSKWEKVTKTM